MARKITKQTVNCVKCLKRKATTMSGYVRRRVGRGFGIGYEEILAGWCSYCKPEGFSGHYRSEMKTESAE